MCKEEMHWRPFPLAGVDEDGNNIYRPFLEKETLERNPRDRPILNILFETTAMHENLRPWVKRDLVQSKSWINKLTVLARRKKRDLEKLIPDDDIDEEEEEGGSDTKLNRDV